MEACFVQQGAQRLFPSAFFGGKCGPGEGLIVGILLFCLYHALKQYNFQVKLTSEILDT